MPSELHKLLINRAEQCREDSQHSLEAYLTELFDRLLNEIDGIKDDNVDRDFLVSWKEKAILADSAAFILQEFPLKGATRRFTDFRVPNRIRDYSEFLAKVEEEINRDFNRAVVYVAWSQRPQEINYVGKASPRNGQTTKVRRLTDPHQQLKQALHNSRWLTFLLPSRGDRLEETEASVIEILRATVCEGELPHCNKRREVASAPRGESIDIYLRALQSIERAAKSIRSVLNIPERRDETEKMCETDLSHSTSDQQDSH